MSAKNYGTIVRDFTVGAKDKAAGYYDKWYRYNRSDDGAAYDAGHRSVECLKADGVKIIECLHALPVLESAIEMTYNW